MHAILGLIFVFIAGMSRFFYPFFFLFRLVWYGFVWFEMVSVVLLFPSTHNLVQDQCPPPCPPPAPGIFPRLV